MRMCEEQGTGIDKVVGACYQHAALKFLSGEKMRNSTLRERFGIEQKNAAQVSQVIRLALDRAANPAGRSGGTPPVGLQGKAFPSAEDLFSELPNKNVRISNDVHLRAVCAAVEVPLSCLLEIDYRPGEQGLERPTGALPKGHNT
ncbi:MAG TPA: hypothetical protein VM120_25350 [Bryobacteraceae bacterium]|nr:hypothetical protein [Bryobacteraceae bacterium]